ncbi:hypothetical protein HDU96_008549 [Phlyctochytrium bullatum]|nr:hypothetical protein HDU96_008549 [Phlyctochytrium bullatum]
MEHMNLTICKDIEKIGSFHLYACALHVVGQAATLAAALLTDQIRLADSEATRTRYHTAVAWTNSFANLILLVVIGYGATTCWFAREKLNDAKQQYFESDMWVAACTPSAKKLPAETPKHPRHVSLMMLDTRGAAGSRSGDLMDDTRPRSTRELYLSLGRQNQSPDAIGRATLSVGVMGSDLDVIVPDMGRRLSASGSSWPHDAADENNQQLGGLVKDEEAATTE